MTVSELSAAILAVRSIYITQKLAPSYYEINNGLCEDFAMDVIDHLKKPPALHDLCDQNFQNEDDTWDWGLLEKYWPMVKLPEGLSQEEMDLMPWGHHIFLEHENRFYDAECPDGVDSFFDLPLFRRVIVEKLRSKGIQADEVMPEDVVPPPMCPVPNPPKQTKHAQGFGM